MARVCYEVFDQDQVLKEGFIRAEDAERWIENNFDWEQIRDRKIDWRYGEWPEER